MCRPRDEPEYHSVLKKGMASLGDRSPPERPNNSSPLLQCWPCRATHAAQGACFHLIVASL